MLSINKIYFKYPTSRKMILNGITFSFERGKKYAIVGVNGSGKSTLAKIIFGLYTPESGNIICNSTPTILFQDFNKYPATVRENITLTELLDNNSKEKVEYIKQKAGLKERIDNMKLGDNTELTTLKDGGQDLSGGEWQRVALARVLWSKSELYILDEPTASLDPLEEIRTFKLYNDLLKEKTVIYITHRLGFVKNVDQVIVMNEGSIAETGTHNELCSRKKSIYKKMFEEQRHWYE